jgi:hypothetical protein
VSRPAVLSRLLPLSLLFVAFVAVGCGGGGQPGSSSAETSVPAPKPHQGGEASIEGFGSEAAGADRAALLTAFRGYLGAVADGEFATACSHLSAQVKGSLSQLAGPRAAKAGCAATLPQLLSPTAARTAQEERTGKIRKVRVKGGMAFVVFHAPGARLYMLTMKREGGEWKATTVSASVLAPSAATLGQ